MLALLVIAALAQEPVPGPPGIWAAPAISAGVGATGTFLSLASLGRPSADDEGSGRGAVLFTGLVTAGAGWTATLPLASFASLCANQDLRRAGIRVPWWAGAGGAALSGVAIGVAASAVATDEGERMSIAIPLAMSGVGLTAVQSLQHAHARSAARRARR